MTPPFPNINPADHGQGVGAMTDQQRRASFEHIGGPHDGDFVLVPVDADGVPPEFYTLGGFDPSQMYLRNPMTEAGADITTQFYDRDIRADDSGVRYVFVYRGEDRRQLPGLRDAA